MTPEQLTYARSIAKDERLAGRVYSATIIERMADECEERLSNASQVIDATLNQGGSDASARTKD